MKNLTFDEKRKYIQDFKGLIVLGDIAKDLKISRVLVSQIISGVRTDHYNVIDTCCQAIEDKLKAIMPQQ